jgi:putative restriction endonuclease
LQNDNLWCVSTDNPVIENNSGDISRRTLLAVNAKGAFSKSIIKKFHDDPFVIKSIVQSLLAQNFPATLHEDILQAIGYSFDEVETVASSQRRCGRFREKVLRAYEYRCAICGFDVRMDNSTIALEAAHIKWHQANGAETENNGLALCALHHKLFDRGAFTLSEKYEVLVSDRAHGSHGFSEWLMNFHGKKILPPQKYQFYPESANVFWHTREVFQGYARDAQQS